MIHLVLTSFGSEADARRIGREMVEARHAACVNILPGARSIFRYEGRVEEESEVLALFKTADADALMAALAAAHAYDLPVIEAWPVALTSPGVADWIAAETGQTR
jgi:periplasmic divalent cation tolerance protein